MLEDTTNCFSNPAIRDELRELVRDGTQRIIRQAVEAELRSFLEEHAGERAALEAKRTPIGPYDVLIAGQALARYLTLITRNIREFKRVRGLRFENWMG